MGYLSPAVLAAVVCTVPGKSVYVLICIILLATVATFALQRWLWPMLVEFLIIGIGLFIVLQKLVFDVRVRDAIVREQGMAYYVLAFLSLVLPLAAGAFLYRLGRRDRG